eukprot:NODE_513_length_6632_cov_0.519301.p3 type:complete len:290 gc:universal NODE_513_length_6632_cov_0.519301:1500-2369(+)
MLKLCNILRAKIQSVAVVGAGQMGSGIAYVNAAHAKKKTIIIDNEQALKKAQTYLSKLLDKDESKSKLLEPKSNISNRFSFVSSIDNLKADFVIEAIPEVFEWKRDLFLKLDQVLPDHSIIASNTSSIPITKLAAVTKRPKQVIGQHFMNPVPVLKLVEIIKGFETSNETYDTTVQLTKEMNKTITTSTDVPGFISNRLLCPFINEAIIALEHGIGTKEDIDTTMCLGMAHPMGPLKLADLIGLDTVLNIMNILHAELGDKYRPSNLLKTMVFAKKFGRKSGEGFYNYK